MRALRERQAIPGYRWRRDGWRRNEEREDRGYQEEYAAQKVENVYDPIETGLFRDPSSQSFEEHVAVTSSKATLSKARAPHPSLALGMRDARIGIVRVRRESILDLRRHVLCTQVSDRLENHAHELASGLLGHRGQ